MSSTITLNLDRDIEDRLVRRGGLAERGVHALAQRTFRVIQRRVPRDTNNLAESFTMLPLPRGGWVIFTEVDYVKPVIKGTKPRRIRARRAKALRWETKQGDVRFAAWVDHPGTKPNSFLLDSLREAVLL